MNKVLLCPERVRQLPAQFSWADQRLARHSFFEQAPAEAWALYLFLLTVADAQGLSYYAERTLCQRLGFEPAVLTRARGHLLRLGLIAYQAPLTQVLSLDHASSARPAPSRPIPLSRSPSGVAQARTHLQRLRQQLGGRKTS
jgi:hypothetical protein